MTGTSSASWLPKPRRAIGNVGIALLVLLALAPLVWLVASSLKAPSEFFTKPIWSLPEQLYWRNYADAWTRGSMGTYLINSVLATVPSILLLLGFSVMAAFALEVMRWRGRSLTLLVFVAGLMVPLQMLLLPLSTMYFETGLLDTTWALILTYTAFGIPFTVFLLAGYFRSMPRELIEAAVIDGANLFQVFRYVSLPQVRNAILTIALVQFFFIWNDILLVLTFIRSTENYTLQMGILTFSGRYGQQDWGPTFAFIVLSMLPTLIIYLIFNRKVTRGLTAGALKG